MHCSHDGLCKSRSKAIVCVFFVNCPGVVHKKMKMNENKVEFNIVMLLNQLMLLLSSNKTMNDTFLVNIYFFSVYIVNILFDFLHI